jgi:hypothetical protein
MIPDTPQLPRCPYCSSILRFWPEKAPVHGCETCLRPLAIIPTGYCQPRIYRIYTLFDLAKYTTALIAFTIIAGLAFNSFSERTLILMTVMVFFVHGSMDLADGLLSLRTGIDRTWQKLSAARAAKVYGLLKTIAGIVLIAGALFGIATRL